MTRYVQREPFKGMEPGATVVVLPLGVPGYVEHFEPYAERPYRVVTRERTGFYHPYDLERYVPRSPHALVRIAGQAVELVEPSSHVAGVWDEGVFRECGEPVSGRRDDRQPVPQCIGRAVRGDGHCTCPRWHKRDVPLMVHVMLGGRTS